jgi:hypothetical protein
MLSPLFTTRPSNWSLSSLLFSSHHLQRYPLRGRAVRARLGHIRVRGHCSWSRHLAEREYDVSLFIAADALTRAEEVRR